MLKNRDFLTILEQFQKKKVFKINISTFSYWRYKNVYKYNQSIWQWAIRHLICFRCSLCKAMLLPGYSKNTILVFEIRKNLDLRKVLVTPKIFLKSRFHCTLLWKIYQILYPCLENSTTGNAIILQITKWEYSGISI